MTGDGNGGTTPMTPPTTDPTLPPDNPPPLAPSFSDINGLTSDQRLPAIVTNPANTNGNGITQSAEMQDSVSAVTDSGDNLMFHVVAGERVAVRVDNSNTDANWAGTNAPPLSTFSYIFDSGSFASKTLADYENGDFYAVTGFWYRSPTDFGVFVDGSPRMVDSLPSGSATYKGNVGGYYWGDAAGSSNTGAPSISGNFIGNINLQVNSGANTFLTGEINIAANGVLPNISLESIRLNVNNNGIFIGKDALFCASGCASLLFDDSSFNARFSGNSVNNGAGGANPNEWPAGMIGTFGVETVLFGDSAVDMLGFFGAIHEDLCAATGTGDAAFCTK